MTRICLVIVGCLLCASVSFAQRPKKEEPKEIIIKPTKSWHAKVPDGIDAADLPGMPITTADDFAKLWKSLRPREALPKVDFAKEFVIIEKSSFGAIKSFELEIVEDRVEHRLMLVDKEGDPHYMLLTFPRTEIDVVDGRLVIKKKEKK